MKDHTFSFSHIFSEAPVPERSAVLSTLGILPKAMFPRLRIQFIVIWGCAHLLPKNMTWGFLTYEHMKEVVDFFQDTFLMHGGQDFLLRLDRGEPINANDFQDLGEIFGIECLLESLRPDVEALHAAPTQAYRSAVLCLDPAGQDCPESKQIVFVDKVNASKAEFRYLGEDGPENVQGAFWTDSKDSTGSLLLSFAKSRDGGMLSNGVWKKDEYGMSYRIRPAGDRIWAVKGINFYYVWMNLIDIVYSLRVIEGTDEAPTFLKIYFTFSPNIFPIVKLFRVHVGECLSWILDLDAFVVETDKGDRENSVIWRRDTWMFEGKVLTYDIVQIINGRGEPVEPAYSQWIEAQKDSDKPLNSIPNGLITETLDSYCDKLSKCNVR